MNDTVTSSDGLRLTLRRWEAADAAAASIVLVHGIGDHSGRYEHVGIGLAEAGFSVTAGDLRGHGRSEGVRGYVDRFSQFSDDVDAFISVRSAPEAPLVLLGHSLGGLIVLSYVLADRIQPDLVVVSAPALAAGVPLAKRVAARVLGAIAPKLTITNELEDEWLSRNPAIGIAYRGDPLVLQKTTTRLGKESLAAIRSVNERLGRLTVPTLVIHGGADTLVPTASSEALGSLPGVERVVFPSFRHESFNEEGGTEAIHTVVDWLRRQLAERARP